jgi:hypothetical protein
MAADVIPRDSGEVGDGRTLSPPVRSLGRAPSVSLRRCLPAAAGEATGGDVVS